MASFTVYVQTNTKIHINVTLSHMFTYVYLHLTLTCQSGAQISILALMQSPIASSGALCQNVSISSCKWVSRLRGRAYVRGGISHCQSHYCLLLLWPSHGTSPCFSFGFLGLDEVFTIGASWAVSSPQSRVPGKLLFCLVSSCITALERHRAAVHVPHGVVHPSTPAQRCLQALAATSATALPYTRSPRA